MIEPTKLLNPTYLFDRRPDSEGILIIVAAVIWMLFLLGSGVVWLTMSGAVRRFPPLSELRSRITTFLFITGFVGLNLVFFRWQGLAYAGSRIWLLIWFIATLIWFIFLLVYRLKRYPRLARLYEATRQFERYLPRSRLPSKGKR